MIKKIKKGIKILKEKGVKEFLIILSNKILIPLQTIQELKEVQKLLNISVIDLLRYFLTLSMHFKFHTFIAKTLKEARKACSDPKLGGWLDAIDCFLLYIIIRHAKPKIVVETGVGPGASSAFILQALEDNKKGILYSIDLPGNDKIVYPKLGKMFNIHVPERWQIGWLIPPWLKYRHKLIVGDSKKELPELLKKIKRLDVFLHDSLHTDEHISMEFNTIFPYICKSGILLCDDVNEYWSLAFIKFCQDNKIPYKVFKNRLGIAKYRM